MSFLSIAADKGPRDALDTLLAELSALEAFMAANPGAPDIVTDALAEAASARECAIFEAPATTLDAFRQKVEIVLRPGITPSAETRKSVLADLDRLIA